MHLDYTPDFLNFSDILILWRRNRLSSSRVNDGSISLVDGDSSFPLLRLLRLVRIL